MISPEYSTGLVSDLARAAIAMFRARPATNSSILPGCSLALTPLRMKYHRPDAPARPARPTSNRNAFSTGRMVRSLLRRLRELCGVFQELLQRLLGAEVVRPTLVRGLRRGGGIHHQPVHGIPLLVFL